jgi:8-amino-7-oxononanoate synthase
MYYAKELKAIKRANIYRHIESYEKEVDFASNDYLGLASRKKSLKRALKLVNKYNTFAPKASLLVNGYHPIHKKFEKKIANANGFSKAIVVGSGFLANIALIEALVRRDDELFIDKEYHASGVLATKLIVGKLSWFKHNCVNDLEKLLKQSSAKRKIIAIEGAYSMSGDIAKKEIFKLANKYNALIIVDEAHSSGTIGDNLLGIFDYYNLEIKPNYIKMGTLGKAYGSYGAYILCSKEIKEFLVNRAKPIIYSTAPSVIDTALALVNLEYILKNSKKLKKKLEKRVQLVKDTLGIKCNSLIVPITQSSNKITKQKQKELLSLGYLVGAIRQPTVDEPIVRLILRLGTKKRDLKTVLKHLANKPLDKNDSTRSSND